MMKIWILFSESQEDLSTCLNKQRRECGEKGKDTGPNHCKPLLYSKNAHPRVHKPIHVRKRLGCSHLRNAKYLPLPPAQMAPPISTLPWTVHWLHIYRFFTIQLQAEAGANICFMAVLSSSAVSFYFHLPLWEVSHRIQVFVNSDQALGRETNT